MPMLLNFVLFQLAWFACVLGGAHGYPWLGPLVVAVVVAYHLAKIADPKSEGLLLLVAACIGAVFDSLLVILGWLAYPSGQWAPFLAPYWIVAMWVAFATTLNVSLAWLKNRTLLTVGLGALGGPLAFAAGEKLGGVIFVAPGYALAALALGWAVIMPTLMALASQLCGSRTHPLGQELIGAVEESGRV